MKQRLGVVAALLGKPDLLILDEPTDGIDPLGRQSIRQIIAEENQRGATVFLNSHLLSETEKICQRVGVLVNGKIVLDGAIEDIRREKHSWEVRFDSIPDVEFMRTLGFELLELESLAFTYNDADIDRLHAALDQARAQNARLIYLQEYQRDLEQVLMELVQEKQS